MANIELVIGDKAWSSWSLRPWLAAKVAKVPFREVTIELRRPATAEDIRRYSPSGKVPALIRGDFTIWDSLAICEYLAEEAPEARLWPMDRAARASARAISAEMHSGFAALRAEYPMDFHARRPAEPPSPEARRDIVRTVDAWRQARRRFGAAGPYLFGHFTIADAMYAPVATRFRTYGHDLARFGDDGTARAYVEALLAMDEMSEWGRGAAAVPCGEA